MPQTNKPPKIGSGAKPVVGAPKGTLTGSSLIPAASPSHNVNKFERAAAAAGALGMDASDDTRQSKVSLTRLRLNPYNPREFYSPAKIAERAKSMATEGQLQALLCALDPNDPTKLIVVDGGYRFKAAESLHWDELLVDVDTSLNSPEKIYLAARACNAEREDQSSFDDAYAWKRLLNEGIFASIAALARSVNINEDIARKRMKLAEIPRATAAYLVEEGATERFCYNIAIYYDRSHHDEVATDRFARIATSQEMSTRELQRAIEKEFPDRPQTRTTPTTYQLKFPVGGVSCGLEIKLFPVAGKLQLSITEAPGDELEKIKDLLQNALKASNKNAA